ncbi:MAG TPA: dephospho-CoA kinase [Candidatus Saccharimonadales bacterium]|nr:dephospho-CoA kinase [Candidatus Saccharimonadales bacterium]
MILLGLTGGIGMGKSTAAGLFERRGVLVVDTDELAREVVAPGEPALAEVRRLFGAEVIGPEGALRRDVVARIVFNAPEKRRELEAVLHPRIRDRWRARVEQWRREGRPWAMVVIPLLFETGAAAEFDAVICVACTPASQAQRLGERGWTPAECAQRIAAQWPVQQKMDRSRFVIWTEPDLDVHAAQVERILARLAP